MLNYIFNCLYIIISSTCASQPPPFVLFPVMVMDDEEIIYVLNRLFGQTQHDVQKVVRLKSLAQVNRIKAC